MLFKAKYAGLCVLGMEIFYILCIGYGLLLSGKAMELHHSLLELMPGFNWGKSGKHGVGRVVFRNPRLGRWLVHRLDA